MNTSTREQAQSAGRKAMADVQALMEQGARAFAGGDHRAALECFTRVLAMKPRHAEALNNRGMLLGQLGDVREALKCFRRVLAIEPGNAFALFNGGVAEAQLEHHEAALACFVKATSIDPKYSDAWMYRGLTLKVLKRPEEALACFGKVLQLSPEHVDALVNGGQVLEALHRSEDALSYFGNALSILHRYAEALGCFERLLASRPGDVHAWLGKGVALAWLDRNDEALACFAETLRIKPDFFEALSGRSLVRLALGQLAEGFREQEVRWQIHPFKNNKLNTSAPLWLGDAPLAGKTILLHHEQGFGDTIQMARYAPLLAQRGARVILGLPVELQSLMQAVPGVERIALDRKQLPQHDFHCPVMSLPLAFGTTLDTIPADIPYLRADPARVSAWSERLGPPARARIGLVWAGRPQPPLNHARDMPLAALRPLLEINADFISLQKHLSPADLATLGSLPAIVRHGESLGDFADTAALIANLDLVIAVDTAVVHLAGALGKPVWIMNRYAPCWRWLRGRSDSPWYPSARLFRQTSFGDWAGVVEQVRVATEQFLSRNTGTGAPAPGAINSSGIPVLMQKGTAAAGRGDHTLALSCFEQVLALDPADAAALHARGRTLMHLARLPEAADCLAQALALRPDALDARSDLATIFNRLGSHDQALAQLDRVLAADPQRPGLHFNRGVALWGLRRHEEALDSFTAALVRDPADVEALFNRGSALTSLHRDLEAQECFDRFLALRPGDVRALLNQGIVVHKLNRPQASLACFEQLLAIDPDNVEAWHGRAGALAALDRIDEARSSFDRALALDPDHAPSLNHRSWNLLSRGELAQGFRDYEHRWRAFPLKHARLNSPAPLWLGDAPLAGKTILLHHEQGYGDTLQFVRYAPRLAERGAQVILRLPPALHRLLESLGGVARIIAESEPLPPHDFHCPMMSLPLAFGTTLQTIPADIPYLRADPARVAAWSARLGPKTRLRIGLAWAGRPYPPINHARDMPLAALRPLLDLDADFISVQKDIAAADLGTLAGLPVVARHGESLEDFADTAALIANLDLLIAVDTSVVHLAGALGKPVWVMNRYAPCWRWLRDRSDSPWYPGARLFKQAAFGDWAGVIGQVRTALESFTAAHAAAAKPAEAERQLQLGIAALRRGDGVEALHQFEDALRERPDDLRLLDLQGSALGMLGRHEAALSCFERILAADANSVAARAKRAFALDKLERRDAALAAYDALLAIAPDLPDAWVNRGKLLHLLGRDEEALPSLDRALELRPDSVPALLNRGVALYSLRRREEALECFSRVLRIAPDQFEAWWNRASLLHQLGRHQEALVNLDRALGLKPDHLAALHTRGNVLFALQRHEEALDCFSRVLELEPGHVEALQNRGIVLDWLNRTAEALACFDRALSIQPHHAGLLTVRGSALLGLDRLDEALASLDQALALDPGQAQAQFNRGVVHLAQGRLQEGFRDQEIRWKTWGFKNLRPPGSAPLWLGQQSLAGKTILLYDEQGLGDTLQFARYVPLVAQRGGRVLMSVPAVLFELMRSLAGVDRLLKDNEPPPPHDFQCPLMSLPLAFGTTLETIPAALPYLHADPARAAAWSEHLGPSSRLRIGLVWAGRQYPPINHARDMPLRALRPLFELDLDFVSLQKELPAADRELLASLPQIARYGEALGDFADTAALVANLDLVIAVDTSVVHLAGALGKPLWVMNRYSPCWRWLRNREDTPWYPGARLFRQTAFSDWSGMMEQVRQALAAFAAGG